MSEIIRLIQKHELGKLLDLYKHMNTDDPVLEVDEELDMLWNEILADPGQLYLVAEVDGKLVSSCMLVIIKNLTRGASPYGC